MFETAHMIFASPWRRWIYAFLSTCQSYSWYRLAFVYFFCTKICSILNDSRRTIAYKPSRMNWRVLEVIWMRIRRWKIQDLRLSSKKFLIYLKCNEKQSSLLKDDSFRWFCLFSHSVSVPNALGHIPICSPDIVVSVYITE